MSSTSLKIIKGKTRTRVLRWGALPFIYAPITGITRAAPAEVTAVGHGLPDGWPVAVVSVLGMLEINAPNTPPRARDFRKATVTGADTVELNIVNSSGFSAYTSGGYLQFYTPVALAGALARMTFKDRVGGATLLALDSDQLGGIALDDTAKTITYTITAEQATAFTKTQGVYDMEIEIAGVVKSLIPLSAFTVGEEVTT